jgi:anti-anti-sigma factor
MPDPPSPKLRAVDVKADGDTVVARIVGPIIESNRAEVILDVVGQAIKDAGSGLRFLVLDFGEVTYINSSGIGACMQLATWAKANGTVPVLYRPSEEVTEILVRCKADRLYRIARDCDEMAAIVSVGGEPWGQSLNSE